LFGDLCNGSPIPLCGHRAMDHCPGVTAHNPLAPKATANRLRPPSSGCTVHAQGLKSWGGESIGVGFCWGSSSDEILPIVEPRKQLLTASRHVSALIRFVPFPKHLSVTCLDFALAKNQAVLQDQPKSVLLQSF